MNARLNLGEPVPGNGNTNSLLDSTRTEPKKFYAGIAVSPTVSREIRQTRLASPERHIP
jgi:hypothetical protein